MFHALLQISFYLPRTPDYFSVCKNIHNFKHSVSPSQSQSWLWRSLVQWQGSQREHWGVWGGFIGPFVRAVIAVMARRGWRVAAALLFYLNLDKVWAKNEVQSFLTNGFSPPLISGAKGWSDDQTEYTIRFPSSVGSRAKHEASRSFHNHLQSA